MYDHRALRRGGLQGESPYHHDPQVHPIKRAMRRKSKVRVVVGLDCGLVRAVQLQVARALSLREIAGGGVSDEGHKAHVDRIDEQEESGEKWGRGCGVWPAAAYVCRWTGVGSGQQVDFEPHFDDLNGFGRLALFHVQPVDDVLPPNPHVRACARAFHIPH